MAVDNGRYNIGVCRQGKKVMLVVMGTGKTKNCNDHYENGKVILEKESMVFIS
jgi:hypothetical protein